MFFPTASLGVKTWLLGEETPRRNVVQLDQPALLQLLQGRVSAEGPSCVVAREQCL